MNDIPTLYQDALALHRRGYLEAAEEGYRDMTSLAIATFGNDISVNGAVSPDVLYERAQSLHRQRRFRDAEAIYEQILVECPDHLGAMHFLGMILSSRGDHRRALNLLRISILPAKTPPSFHNNFGVALKEAGRMKEAKSAFLRAIAIDPNYADAHSNLGLWFLLHGEFQQAETSLQKTLALKPNHPDAPKHLAELHFRHGNAFAEQEKFAEANRSFHEAASIRKNKDIWRFKSLGFCPTVFSDEKSLDDYWTQLDRSLDFALAADFSVDWRTLPLDGFIPSFNLPHQGRCCKEVREKFARLFERHFPQERPAQKSRNRYRIGFHVFAGHEGGFLRGTSGILERLDRKRFEVVVLCPDKAVERFRREIYSDDITFVPLGGSFEQVARQARDADCDLIDYRKAGSDPWSYFLPFTRPAPVQCTSYGTHGTSGIPAIDYFLSSSFVEPDNAQQYYTERLVCLDAMPTWQRRHPLPENVNRNEFGLPAKGAVYFCPHRTSKYHPMFDPIFKRILDGDPTGHLVLLSGRDPRGNTVLHERLQRNLGTARLKRVSFFPALPFEKYLRLLVVSTMIIDSPEYAGGLTSFDAFSFGVPEVTISGPLHVQNFATGIYRRMELDDLPCQTVDEYVKLALRLGREPEYRLNVSKNILERNPLIFEDADTVPEHERIFEHLLSSR